MQSTLADIHGNIGFRTKAVAAVMESGTVISSMADRVAKHGVSLEFQAKEARRRYLDRLEHWLRWEERQHRLLYRLVTQHARVQRADA